MHVLKPLPPLSQKHLGKTLKCSPQEKVAFICVLVAFVDTRWGTSIDLLVGRFHLEKGSLYEAVYIDSIACISVTLCVGHLFCSVPHAASYPTGRVSETELHACTILLTWSDFPDFPCFYHGWSGYTVKCFFFYLFNVWNVLIRSWVCTRSLKLNIVLCFSIVKLCARPALCSLTWLFVKAEQSGELLLGHIAVVGTTMVKWQQSALVVNLSKYPRIPQAPLNRPNTEGLCRGSYGSRLLALKLP